ncbi:MAG: hypothetical protein AAF483_03230 [Planctomycetota bacterium]
MYQERPASPLDTQSFSVPIGAALFPKEIQLPPRPWFELMYGKDNVRRYTVMPHGGHFASMEEPDLLIGEVRAFSGTVR